MKNTGLKSFTKQLANQVGNANISVNLNKEQANLHIALPLVSTVGLSPFSASVIYNYQNKSADGIFGNGFKPDCYAKIERSGDKYTVTNADGSVDVYEKGVVNSETQMTVTNISGSEYVTKGCWHVDDKFGNKKIYGALTEYPQRIEAKSGDVINFDFVASDKKISNAHGDSIVFARGSNGKVTNVKYFHNDTTNATVQLGYSDDNNLQTLQYYNDRNALVASTRITYAEDSVTVTDEISGAYSKYTFADSRVTTVESGIINQADSVHTATIVYGNNVTTVTDWRGKTAVYCFDGDGMPAYQTDSDGNVVGFVFDPVTKSLLSQSSPVSAKRAKDNLFPQSVADYTAQDVTVTKVQTDDAFFGDILNDSLCRVAGSGSRGVLSHKVTSNGISTDTVTAVIWCKQLTPATDDCYAQVALSTLKNGGTLVTDYRRLTRKTLNNAFQLITLGITAQSSFDSIELTVLLRGGASVEIGGVQVLRKDFGAFYQYDGKGNATQMSQGGATTNVGYNTANLPSTVSGADSTAYSCKYDGKGNLTQVDLAYDVTVTNEYDEHNRVTKSTTTSADGLCMETTKQYDQQNGRFISSQTDELGVTVAKYEYDEFGKISRLVDALGATTEFTYHDSGLIKDILLKNAANTRLAKATYDYDDKHRLIRATLSNGSVYGFTYDNSGNIENISVNGVTAFKFCYDVANGNVVSQQYGESGDKFTFAYNADNQIQAVNYVSANGIVSKRFTYAYNDDKQLEVVCDQDGNTVSSYVYDQDGRVTRVTSELAQIDYRYDNLSQVNNVKQTVDGQTLYQSFDTVARSKGVNPQSLVTAFASADDYIGIFGKNGYLIGSKAVLPPINHSNQEVGVQLRKENLIPCAYVDSSNTLSYMPENRFSPRPCGCVKFWFKPSKKSGLTKQCIFSIKSIDTTQESIYVYLKSGKLYLETINRSNKTQTLITSDQKIIEQQWNYFALTFFNRCDEGDTGVTEYAMMLNTHLQTFSKVPMISDVDVGGMSVYNIGHRYDGSKVQNVFTGYIACLDITRRWYNTPSKLRRYYNLSKEYVMSNGLYDGDACDCSLTTLYTNDNSVHNTFDIYPLHNSWTSLKGNKPVTAEIRYSSIADKDRTFNFNSKSGRYAYVADGFDLKYDFNQSKTGTIMMRVYSETDNELRYIFQAQDRGKRTLSLFVNESGVLCLENQGTVVSTGFNFTSNQWHTVGVSWVGYSAGDSFIEYSDYNVMVLFDGKVSKHSMFEKTFDPLTVTVGRAANVTFLPHYSMGSDSTSYALNGQIEMLCASKQYCSDATLNKLASEIACLTKTSLYDQFGRIKAELVLASGNSVLSKFYSYKSRQDRVHTSSQVDSEIITTGVGVNTVRQYIADDAGNVTAISDTQFGNHTYVYDKRGFLTKDDDTAISYDANGNITKMGSVSFSYDPVIKDRLVKVGDDTITYDAANPLNPVKFGDRMSFKFEGRRLTELKTIAKYEYKYNQQGLRVEKRVQNDVIASFVYDGDKIITQITPSCRLDFLYDEYNNLYGFIKDNSDKYFYIRDKLHNILGIIDISGNIVAQYDYTAYGTTKVTLNTNGIGTINPFRYKGYYYDSESGLYYCQSRYYVSIWGRWLNGSQITTETTNAFVYAGNNPIGRDTAKSSNIDTTNAGTSYSGLNVSGYSNLPTISGNWFKKLFSIVNSQVSHEIYSDSIDWFFGGLEFGCDKTVFQGDKSLINLTLQTSKNGEFWKAQMGLTVNIEKFHIGFSKGFGEKTISIGYGKYSFEYVFGIARAGYTISWEDGDDRQYVQYYGRTILMAGVIAACIFAPEVVVGIASFITIIRQIIQGV